MHGMELGTKTRNTDGEGKIHNVVYLSKYIEAILGDILVETNIAVSYHQWSTEVKPFYQYTVL